MHMIDHSRFTFSDNPQAALADYLALGYHIEPNVISDEVAHRLIDASKQLQDAKEGNYRPCMMPHRQDKLYRDAMGEFGVVSIMSQLIDGTVMGLQTEFFYCPPGTQGFSLHQDNFFVQAPKNAFASAWMALTDTYPEKGGLIVYPKTHLLGELPVEKIDLVKDAKQDPNANNEQTIIPEGYAPCHAVVPKGAVLFIHGHLVHGSESNITNDWRYVLLCTYIREGEPFRSGNYAQREAMSLC